MQIEVNDIDWKATAHRGVFLSPVYRDEASGDTVVLIRMEPGCGYPAHTHVGDEAVLVLNGGYRDEEGEYSAGTQAVHAAGTTHAPVALEGVGDCVLLATVAGGIDLGG